MAAITNQADDVTQHSYTIITTNLPGYTVAIPSPTPGYGFLLFRSNLSDIDSNTDDFSCLHPNGTRGLTIPAGRVKDGDRDVFSALAPGARVPMIYGTRMLIAAADLLESVTFRALNTSCKKRKF